MTKNNPGFVIISSHKPPSPVEGQMGLVILAFCGHIISKECLAFAWITHYIYFEWWISDKYLTYIFLFNEPCKEIENLCNVSEFLLRLYYKFVSLSILFETRLRAKRDRNNTVRLGIPNNSPKLVNVRKSLAIIKIDTSIQDRQSTTFLNGINK
jgi:hypothetical protein